MALRVETPLPDWVEEIVTRIIGAAIEVHRRLGPGLAEGQYEDAMLIELGMLGLRCKRQHIEVIKYRDRPLRPQRIDLIVEDQVLVEIKAVERLQPVHKAQVVSYLRATTLRIGLLMNFNAPVVVIKRVIL